MIEMVELLKTDIKLQYVLISLAQEQVIKSPGFPQIYIDTLILAHTNQTEFDTFRADKKNEALHDRMYPVMVPWNLKVDDEIKIYEKMINDSDFRDIHIAPHTLKVAAEFAVMSRLVDSSKVSNKIEKMKLYNGEITEGFKKSDIDAKAVRQEGKDKGEGMSGISPRFIINALNVALGSKEEKKCVNAIDIIRYLRDNFDHHIGIAEEDKERFLNLLIGDKDSVSAEYKEVAKKEVNMAFLYAYEEQANTLFDNYMRNVSAFCKKEKIHDSITGEYSDADEKLMRSIEELVPGGVPENSKSEFRNGIFVYKASALENKKKFSYKNYPPLKDAIEKKLMGDLKSVVSLSLADTTSTDPKTKRRSEKAFKTLLKNGYCKECANVLLSFIGEVLRKEE
jgi:serine protein kinase